MDFLNLSADELREFSAVVIAAPTASGKTDLACQLYDRGGFEIVSVDSAMIYQDMNIGTAKPSKNELMAHPHHLVDIIRPDETYSVARFIDDCTRVMTQIHKRGHTPILVGGTMMYFNALLFGLNDLPPSDIHLQSSLAKKNTTELYQQLTIIDSIYAKKIKPNDTQRIIRALCVYEQTGKRISQWQDEPMRSVMPKNYAFVGIMPPRDVLHARILTRLEQMWDRGFLGEVYDLCARYQLSADMPSMRAVGYRQAFDFVQKNPKDLYATPCQNTKNLALYATRQLAKRQCTWLHGLQKKLTAQGVRQFWGARAGLNKVYLNK